MKRPEPRQHRNARAARTPVGRRRPCSTRSPRADALAHGGEGVAAAASEVARAAARLAVRARARRSTAARAAAARHGDVGDPSGQARPGPRARRRAPVRRGPRRRRFGGLAADEPAAYGARASPASRVSRAAPEASGGLRFFRARGTGEPGAAAASSGRPFAQHHPLLAKVRRGEAAARARLDRRFRRSSIGGRPRHARLGAGGRGFGGVGEPRARRRPRAASHSATSARSKGSARARPARGGHRPVRAARRCDGSSRSRSTPARARRQASIRITDVAGGVRAPGARGVGFRLPRRAGTAAACRFVAACLSAVAAAAADAESRAATRPSYLGRRPSALRARREAAARDERRVPPSSGGGQRARAAPDRGRGGRAGPAPAFHRDARPFATAGESGPARGGGAVRARGRQARERARGRRPSRRDVSVVSASDDSAAPTCAERRSAEFAGARPRPRSHRRIVSARRQPRRRCSRGAGRRAGAEGPRLGATASRRV